MSQTKTELKQTAIKQKQADVNQTTQAAVRPHSQSDKSMQPHLTMKHLPPDDRPVEKILHQGPSQLSDAELLAVIIRSGSREETALSLCQRLLSGQDGMAHLADQSLEELMQLQGIGPVKATQIKAALEIGLRISRSRGQRGQTIKTPDDALILLDAEMRNLPREEMRLVLLDTRSRLIKMCCVSQGGLSAAVIYPRDLFREAVKANAASMILAHNHPSGDATPSQDDIETTQRIIDVGNMMGIRVVDHLILARGGSVSLKQQGYI